MMQKATVTNRIEIEKYSVIARNTITFHGHDNDDDVACVERDRHIYKNLIQYL
jgi:hypothetical protein